MNLLAAKDFTYYLKNVFADWAIALFIFFAVLLVLAIIFKGPKVFIGLLIAAAVIAGGFVLAAFIAMLATWDTLRMIDFAVKWAPTVIFVTTIIVSTLVNAKRGLRKSLILLANAVAAGVFCIIFFYVCVNSLWVDKIILTVTNAVLGGNTLQNMLGVSAGCETLREIFAEYLPTLFGGDIQILLAANPQYIVTLADMAFRIVFALISFILYFELVFILYVIYFFAYPERRYKKKVNLAVTNNATDRTYHKHHIGGGVVGLVRGITVGLLALSFIGSSMFIVTGGKGNGTLGDYDLENDDYNYYYSIYRSIDSYGTQGIFKILNMITDSNDTPFYLFAADMVLSGNLDSEENDIDNKNIKFREELASFIGFAKDTMNLLMKYGEEDVVAIINGNGGENAFDRIVGIMAEPEFRTEFDDLIEEFNSQTYIINLGMSLVNAIVEHIDEISFTSTISDDNKELIKLLFKKGHLSDYIPDERKIKQDIADGIAVPSANQVRPRIKVSHLLDKKDVRRIVQVALSIISGENQTEGTLNMVRMILPAIQQLSILQTSRANEMDPVLARLYCFVENKYLTAPGEEGVTYKEVLGEDIKWVDEIHVLLDVADDALALWDNISEEGRSNLDKSLAIFDAESPNYAENVKRFNSIRHALEKSDIIGTVLSTSFMYNMMKLSFTAISGRIYVPDNLVYNRKVNADGSVTMGEMYYFFGGFALLNSPENRELALKLIGGEEVVSVEMLDALSAAAVSTDEDGNSLSDYFTESALLRSLLSIIIIERGGDTISIPQASLETLANGETVNMINKVELKQLLDNMSLLSDFVKPLVVGEDHIEHIASIAEYLRDEQFNYLVENNRIFEGTVSHFLSNSIKGNEFVIVPAHLLDSVDGWVTTDTLNGGRKKGELRNLLDALKVADVDLAVIFRGEFGANELMDMLVTLDTNTAEDFLASEILHYFISNYLIEGPETGGLQIIVPNGARVKTQQGDSIEYIVKKSELLKLFTAVSRLGLSAEANTSSLLYSIVVNKDVFSDSLIMAASIVHMIVNNDEIRGEITIPDVYLTAGEKTALEDYNSSNVWKTELPRFIDALDEILGISKKGKDFVFDADSIKESFSGLISGLNKSSTVKPELTKLQLCYLSDIARSEITARLDTAFLDGGIVPREIISEVKSHGYYQRDELQALCDALVEMGIEGLDGLTDFDLSLIGNLNGASKVDPSKTRFEVIYSSRIVAAIITNSLNGALSPSGIDHSKAYEDGVRIYRYEEVESIYYVFGGFDDLDIKRVDLDKLSERLYDENGVTHSYLIASAVSTLLKNSGNLIIPADALDGEGCILPEESSLVIAAYRALCGADNLEDIGSWKITEIPADEEMRELLFKSKIMRATITFNLGEGWFQN